MAAFGALSLLVLTACSPREPAPRTPEPVRIAAVCDATQPGPAQPPDGAVRVDPAVPGDLIDKTEASPAGTTFWLSAGEHSLGTGRYSQVAPKQGNTYLGAPGAVLEGGQVNQYAFTGDAADVTIRHLTVQGFVPPHNEGVVNHDSADGWVLEHNTIQHNGGAGLMAGARQQVRGNCLRENGQYGINAYKAGNTITGLVVEGNEIVGNNTDDWESRIEGCGCTGGVKFWAVNGADVVGNWVHDNRGVGLWGDTNNNDFLIAGNLIERNDSTAIFYETSYNAVIRDNTIRANNWVEGRTFAERGDSFPAATIYLSESGGEPRIPARTDRIEIVGNVLEDNWSGITLWENADRFCNSPANTSSGSCTLLVDDPATCSAPGIETEPLLSDCRWKTQRVEIHGNRFTLDPAVVGCTVSCGRMALLSNFGTYPDWSPYVDETVQESITFEQDNQWHDNTYVGPWSFMPTDTSQVLEPEQWQTPPYRQDQGSTFAPNGGG
ncbi:Right handed beta helix region [Amycolatopsis marina]|uniref:Right handed beta helix region n=1 Tax=Amycolatopsis marina TaxID=490629 RepID=A0A1I0XBL4_9PSEU|nr:right-handed parallel beta-helix repeat-containing protein [Amycolatopsis marina]SFA98067.1 Right handed beta helix region [Amycolatopsis marina]